MRLSSAHFGLVMTEKKTVGTRVEPQALRYRGNGVNFVASEKESGGFEGSKKLIPGKIFDPISNHLLSQV